MPIYTAVQCDVFDAHGSRFASFVSTERGATTLCAWRLEVAPELRGVAHRPSHEEVILVLRGELGATLDGIDAVVPVGGVIHVPAGSELRVDGGPEGATAWVTTTPGLTATTGDERIAPPWAQ